MDAVVPCLTKQLWFLNTLVTIHRSAAESSGADRGLSVLEHQAPLHDSPPLHIHASEDEVFIVLDGELHLRVGTTDHVAKPGAVLVAPKNVPHTYRVDSTGGARWLTVTGHGDFEQFVCAMGRPAVTPSMPEASGPPSAADVAALGGFAQRFGIELVGPPLGPAVRDR